MSDLSPIRSGQYDSTKSESQSLDSRFRFGDLEFDLQVEQFRLPVTTHLNGAAIRAIGQFVKFLLRSWFVLRSLSGAA